LNGRDLTTSSILNDATDLVRATASPWGALLVIAALPFRFLQVEFVERLAQLGGEAKHYGRALQNTASLAIAAFILLLFFRAVYVRACRLADAGESRQLSLAPFRLSLASLAVYLVTGLAFQTLSILLCFTVIAIPILAIFGGLAAATSDQPRTPSLGTAVRLLGRYTARPATLVGLMLVLAVAFLIIAINLFFTFALLLCMAGGLACVDTTRFDALFTPTSRLFDLLIVAGALALLEPFWMAISVTYVKRVDSRRSGDDLRSWFSELTTEDEPLVAGGER
jgi:hypothetical protein